MISLKTTVNLIFIYKDLYKYTIPHAEIWYKKIAFSILDYWGPSAAIWRIYIMFDNKNISLTTVIEVGWSVDMEITSQ
jgi:hypothetical protein